MTADVAPKSPSFWEDLVDIFFSPAQVFARRAGKGFGMALLVLTIAVGGLFIGTKPLFRPVFDAVWTMQEKAIHKANPQMTDEQLQHARSVAENVFQPIGVIVGTPIAALFVGLMLWLLGMLFDARENLADACMIGTYASFPKILAIIAGAIVAFLRDPSQIVSPYNASLGLGFFVAQGTSPVLGAVLGRVELFTLWETALIGVGLYVVGKVTKSQAAIVAILIWVIGMLPALYGALRAG